MKYSIYIRKHPVFFSLLVGGLFFLTGSVHAQVKYKFTSTGLGLGTDSPVSLLHLKGSGGNLVFETDFNPNIFLGTSDTYSNRFLRIMNSSSASNGAAGGVKTGGLLVSGDYSFADPIPGRLIVNGLVGVNNANPQYALDIYGGSMRIQGDALSDTESSLTGISLANRGAGGTSNIWTLYTAAVGGGYGVNPNAFEIWHYPPGESIPRFKILPDGTTLLAPSGGVVGIGTVAGNYKLNVDGNTNISGYLYVGGVYYDSDARFKTGITAFTQTQMNRLYTLKGVNYLFNPDYIKDNKAMKGIQYGLIAQEVQAVFPDLVSEDDKGFLSVNYIGLIPLLIENAKAQKTEIEALKAEVERLKAEKARMAGLEERMAAIEQAMLRDEAKK